MWTIGPEPFKGPHFATFPKALAKRCIVAGSRPGDLVFDMFFGSGTTGEAAQDLGRDWIACELNPVNQSLQDKRTRQIGLSL